MWLLVALVAQFIFGTSAVFDKSLLRRGFFDPWVYTFWIGVFGLASLLLAPFGLKVLPLPLLFLALGAGSVFIASLFFLFVALKRGNASTVVTFTGGCSSLASFTFAALLLHSPLTGGSLAGFLFLLCGAFLLFLSEKRKMLRPVLTASIIAAVLFGFYGVLAKVVFEQSSFITGFVFIKLGAALTVFLLLAVPRLRRRAVVLSQEAGRSERLWYGANMVYAGTGSALIHVAISLAHPTLVEATQSFQYVVTFFSSWLWFGERFQGRELWGKIAATILIGVGVSVLALAG